MSPTERTLKFMREQGYRAEKVERRVPFAQVTQDLYGFVDVLCVGHGRTVAVQTTTASNMAARRRKLSTEKVREVQDCLAAGWHIELHGWAKRKVKRGGKAYRYELIREDIVRDGGSGENGWKTGKVK